MSQTSFLRTLSRPLQAFLQLSQALNSFSSRNPSQFLNCTDCSALPCISWCRFCPPLLACLNYINIGFHCDFFMHICNVFWLLFFCCNTLLLSLLTVLCLHILSTSSCVLSLYINIFLLKNLVPVACVFKSKFSNLTFSGFVCFLNFIFN